jgi:hypothetical protein
MLSPLYLFLRALLLTFLPTSYIQHRILILFLCLGIKTPSPQSTHTEGKVQAFSYRIYTIFLVMYVIQLCSICCPSDSFVSEDAGIKLRTVATLQLTARCSNHLDRSHRGWGSALYSTMILTFLRIHRPSKCMQN